MEKSDRSTNFCNDEAKNTFETTRTKVNKFPLNTSKNVQQLDQETFIITFLVGTQ